MVERAEGYEGYLGIEAARNPDGCGVAAVYWKDNESILAFARDPEHRIAKKKGREFGIATILSASAKLNATTGGQRNSDIQRPS